MPLVRISLMEGRPQAFSKKAGDIVNRVIVDFLQVPGKALQVITEYGSDPITYGSSDAVRRDGLVVIQITLSEGRTAELKNSLFQALVKRLSGELDIRPADIFINLVEIKTENWAWRNT